MSDWQKFSSEPVPGELKKRAQWLLWDASKDRKQPFTLTHGRLAPASGTNPDDRLTFEGVTGDTAPLRRDDQESPAVGGAPAPTDTIAETLPATRL